MGGQSLNFGSQWPKGKYRVIYADPPWRFDTYSDKGRSRAADNHYRVMGRDDLLALPVDQLAADNGCVLLLWTTSDQLGWAVSTLIPAWGFIYKSVGPVWLKTKKPLALATALSMTPGPLCPEAVLADEPWAERIEQCLCLGLGYHFQQQVELCLVATTPKVPPRKPGGVRQVVAAPRREHSRKPDEVYDRIEARYPGPYIELFSRTERAGWDCWGDECGKFEEEVVPVAN